MAPSWSRGTTRGSQERQVAETGSQFFLNPELRLIKFGGASLLHRRWRERTVCRSPVRRSRATLEAGTGCCKAPGGTETQADTAIVSLAGVNEAD